MKTIDQNSVIWLNEAKDTHSCGRSLANTLYETPVTILLYGEIGSGKTTFIGGFAEALGIPRNIVSPTFALEHRYETAEGVPFLHIDLYRLSKREAAQFVEHTADFEGYRCIEWAQHLPTPFPHPFIAIRMEDTHGKRGRKLETDFHDLPLPSPAQIALWRDDLKLPPSITAHCDAVADFSVRLGRDLMDRGRIVRLSTLAAAGTVHDLLRFVDFTVGGPSKYAHGEEPEIWRIMRTTYGRMRHEQACARFLQEQSFSTLGSIVEVHGLRLPPKNRRTIEQKLLYYADKRVCGENVVSLEERFADFANRYRESPLRLDGEVWYRQAKELEEELFGGRPPF